MKTDFKRGESKRLASAWQPKMSGSLQRRPSSQANSALARGTAWSTLYWKQILGKTFAFCCKVHHWKSMKADALANPCDNILHKCDSKSEVKTIFHNIQDYNDDNFETSIKTIYTLLCDAEHPIVFSRLLQKTMLQLKDIYTLQFRSGEVNVYCINAIRHK